MTLFEELKYRGFLNQCTDEESLDNILKSKKITFYIGFDCTAKSLHVGSLIQIMIMRLFQKYGHTPIILIGTGTTRIGDPSGKDETRKILTDEEININAENLKIVFDRYLTLGDNDNNASIKDNADNPRKKRLLKLNLLPEFLFTRLLIDSNVFLSSQLPFTF